jgi:hypothetical protein
MKRILVVLGLLFLIGASAFASDLLLDVSLDVFLGLRVGVEYRFHPRMAVKADLGATFYGTFVADAFYVVYLLPGCHRFRLNLLLGIPTASAPMTLQAAMVSLGASLTAGYRFTDAFSMDFRLGGGFPLFFEPGKDIIRPLNTPFFIPYVWPDLVLGFHFALPRRRRKDHSCDRDGPAELRGFPSEGRRGIGRRAQSSASYTVRPADLSSNELPLGNRSRREFSSKTSMCSAGKWM